MRRSRLWCAVALAVFTGSASAADLVLCGPVVCGTYTATDADIYIYNATLVPGAGGTTTLKLVAKNGQITVGPKPGVPITCGPTVSFGIDGDGADRAVGSALAGGSGFHVVLETNDGGGQSAPRPRDITIDYLIDCSGGDGATGPNGKPGSLANCTYREATNGGAGFPGGAGGSISITSAEDIWCRAALRTFGGQGGWGGAAGNSIGAPARSAGHGANGGPGGPVTIVHSSLAPSSAQIEIAGAGGGVNSSGGAGGQGGDGGTGNPLCSNGGVGGKGGDGGILSVDGRSVRVVPTSGAVSLTSAGGNGGEGGRGEEGEQGSCILYCLNPVLKRTIYATPGSDGGLGGHGGDGASITVYSDAAFVLGASCGLNADGGNGGMSGGAGNGSIEVGNNCGAGIPCEQRFAYDGGHVWESGDGGNGGPITVACYDLTLNTTTLSVISSTGGNGADGPNAASGAVVCCGNPTAVVDMSAGGQGGFGGTGGDGGAIHVLYFIANHGLSNYLCCGGAGGDGGSGGNGDQTGSAGDGGLAGSCGSPGALTFNSLPQPVSCAPCIAAAGNPGLELTCPVNP